MKWTPLHLTLWFLLFFPALVQAQQSKEAFGKNRIQYRQYNWEYLSSQNFDLYYYDGRKKTATLAIQYLESQFNRITDLIGYLPYSKVKIFLYSSISHLQQTNVGLSHAQFDVGGETEFVSPYVELAYTGSLEELKERLIYKTVETLTNEMMFGGSLKDAIRNAILLNLPDWCIPGASNYIAKGWNVEMDDYMRQLFYAKKINRISQLKGREAYLVGHSIWNYIAQKYGEGSISSILNYTRIIRNVRKSIAIMLGVSFKGFIADWYQYYFKMGAQINKNYVFPDDATVVNRRHRKSVRYTELKVSPDGNKVAYTERDRGRFVIKIRSVEDNGDVTVISGGNRVFNQEVDYNIPLVGWVDAKTLGVIGIQKGEHIFWLYDLVTKSKISRKLRNFSNIRSLNFSENGSLAVLSADREGNNDLFLISTRRDKTKRLTNDVFDDLDAEFVPNSKTIVFSSNRTTDTINTVVKKIENIPKTSNLYFFNLDTTVNTVRRITNALGKNYLPKAYDKNTIYYLSDQRGIANIFRYDIAKGVYSQVTYFNSSIEKYDLNFTHRYLAMTMRKKTKHDVFIIPNFDYRRQAFQPTTPRIKIQQLKSLEEKKNMQESQTPLSMKELVIDRLEKKQPKKLRQLVDSLITPSQQINADSTRVVSAVSEEKPIITTKDYVFEDELPETDESSDTFLNRYMKAKEKTKLKGPFRYRSVFTYKSLVTSFGIDPLTGFNVRFETQMSDILENYRFFGGLEISFDGESNKIYAEAQYLPHRIDYNTRLERKVIFWRGSNNFQTYTWQKIELGASLPFSVKWRFALKPFLEYTEFIDQGLHQSPLPAPPVIFPAAHHFYGGTKLELVYDNSLSTGLNIVEGTRGKINFTHHESFENELASFSHLFIDLRHYQKIYKEAVFAIRGYMGTFFGNAPKKYALGGMDNWFFNKSNKTGTGNPLAQTEGYNNDLIFTEFATSLRGFNYSTLHGNNVMLANLELRLPIIRLLSTDPISSNFLKNIQFVAFYDIGTSWVGPLSALSERPTTRTLPEKVTGNPFRVEVADFISPWLYSYGFGLRAKIVGFYTKFDLAWPVQNYRVGVVQFHATLGLDF